MILVLSPAKSLNYESPAQVEIESSTRFKKESSQLVKELRKFSREELSKLMSISNPLADLNTGRYKQWRQSPKQDQVKQAIFAFNGDVYTGFEADTLPNEKWAYAQQHVRILSGLYGLLRPMDMIQPYRLEMGTKLRLDEYKNLYEFWGGKITKAVAKDLKQTDTEQVVINLASQEYFKSVKPKELKRPVINIEFKDWKNGTFKVISFFAKKARGRMAREIVLQEMNSADQIKQVSFEGYAFDPSHSTETTWTFTRTK